MLRVGLTGGIGSGKSAAAEIFSRLGAPVIDADVIARELVYPGTEALREIVAAFGEDVLLASGELDRRRLAERVFNDPASKARLEQILHPRVRASIGQRQSEYRDAHYVVIVIPLLLESGLQDMVDRILVVDAGEAVRIRRVCKRDGRSEEQVRAVIRNQLDSRSRREAADDLIVNEGSLQDLEAAVAKLHRAYLDA